MSVVCSDERIPIPGYTNYLLGADGEIRYRKSGCCVDTPVNKDGEVIVTLLNDRNSRHVVKLAKLVLLNFGCIDPDANYNMASVTYKDGNQINLNIQNLEWKFDETWKLPINVPGVNISFETYITINGYSDYEINGLGIIVRKRNGTHVKAVRGTRGYMVATLTDDAGYRAPVKVHRLLALMFLAHPADVSDLVVNHKDGNKCNNVISNLEWVSPAYNIQHAYAHGLVGTIRRGVLVMQIDTGDIVEFPGITACAMFFSVRTSTLIDPLTNTKGIRNYKGYYLKYTNDNRPWPDRNERPAIYGEHAVVTKSLETGEVIHHRSMQDAGKFLGVTTASVFNQLKYEVPRAYKGHLVRRDGPDVDWSMSGVESVAVIDKTARIKLIDIYTKEEAVYNSLTEASKAIACPYRSLYTALRRQSPYGRYQIEQVKMVA